MSFLADFASVSVAEILKIIECEDGAVRYLLQFTDQFGTVHIRWTHELEKHAYHRVGTSIPVKILSFPAKGSKCVLLLVNNRKQMPSAKSIKIATIAALAGVGIGCLLTRSQSSLTEWDS